MEVLDWAYKLVMLAIALGGVIYGYGLLRGSVGRIERDFQDLSKKFTDKMEALACAESTLGMLQDSVKTLQDSVVDKIFGRINDIDIRLTRIETVCKETRCKAGNVGRGKERE